MNYKEHKLIVLLGAGIILTAGCAYDKTAHEPLTARDRQDTLSSAYFDAQVDNAVLSSMTVADIHFLPDRSELNSLGQARLAAIAHYLEQYGGKVVVDSGHSDELIREQRLAAVRESLVGQGLDPEGLAVEQGLTRGRGQDAGEATLFYNKNLVPASASAGSQTPAALSGRTK